MKEKESMVPLPVNLKNKTAVVTGGGGVLCSTFAETLGECGARVAVLDIRKEAAEEVASRVNAAGGTALGVGANVLDPKSLAVAEEKIRDEFGSADILINGAGGNHPKGTTGKEHFSPEDLEIKDEKLITFFDLDPEGIEFVFNLNFLGTLLSSQSFAKGMAEKGKGTIVNISSMSAFTPLTKTPAYSGAKAAVSNFTRWLAVHFSKAGIRVNAIAPGFFLTEQNYRLLKNEDGSWTQRAEKIINATPFERFGEPKELLGTLLYLLDDAASGFVTGTVIPVDGGFSAYSGV
jgi:NAD(P)-dependent dehydrogenase (short-subunit alcohol dehydrogenase family)